MAGMVTNRIGDCPWFSSWRRRLAGVRPETRDEISCYFRADEVVGYHVYRVDADGRAVAIQPYWSRIIRTACKLGVPPIGECGIGAGPMFCFSPSGEASHGKMAWMFSGCALMCNKGQATEEWMHKLHKLNAVPFQILTKTPRAHAFAKRFVKQHGQPRRVALDNLRLANEEGETDHWVWDRVFWEYADGRRVEYPNDIPQQPQE